VNMLASSVHVLAKPKSHSLSIGGSLLSNKVLSSLRSLYTFACLECHGCNGFCLPPANHADTVHSVQSSPSKESLDGRWMLGQTAFAELRARHWMLHKLLAISNHLWATKCLWQYSTAPINCCRQQKCDQDACSKVKNEQRTLMICRLASNCLLFCAHPEEVSGLIFTQKQA